jgi:thymidylate synthase (FAD)
MKIVEPSVTLLWVTPEPEKVIELCGRVCYKSEDKITPGSSGEFCRRMVKSGHHAMIEHACASFKIVTDRGVSHEIVRHRLASYSMESTRYCNYGSDKFGRECAFIEPPGLKHAKIDWIISCEDAEATYFEMLRQDCTPQIARAVLPNCLKTEIVMTCNFREWRHFITLRASKAAHPQIRPIVLEIYSMLYQIAPNIFGDLGADA